MNNVKGIKRVFRALLLTLLPCTLCHCSGLTHRAILTPEQDKRSTGIRYYDSSPYLFIHTDNEGGLTSELCYLPDLTKKRAAKPFAILAKNKTTLTWDAEGVLLTGSNSELDSAAVPTAVVAALQEVGKTFAKSGAFLEPTRGSPPGQLKAPEAYLFKIIKRRGQWGLIGTKTDTPEFLAIPVP